MGIEVKRVALDFNWPLEKIWSGYINNDYESCADCDGSGSTIAMQRLTDLVSLLMLSGSDAARGECHPYFLGANSGVFYHTASLTCGLEMVELTTALAGRTPSFVGYDVCDRWSAAKKIIAAAGLPETWGQCASCEGHGETQASRASSWKPTEPPVGEGYQMWETVSEGSPISPVFTTPEDLADYMLLARPGYTKKSWLNMIRAGYAPSMILTGREIMTGPDAAIEKGS